MRCDACELPLTQAAVPRGFLEEPTTGKHACSLNCAECFSSVIGLPDGSSWHWVSWQTYAERQAAQREHGDDEL